jgi:lipopolysaccharide transport protein LptA
MTAQFGARIVMIWSDFKQTTMSIAPQRVRITTLLALLALAVAGHSAEERISGPSQDDTVIIKAREAWEDEAPDTVHFRGDFHLETQDWTVSADQATLYGKLDDPETVVLTGMPALITIHSAKSGQSRAVSGEATRIVYEKERNRILMEGGVRLSSDDSVLRGEEIEYRIDDDRINAAGKTGVRIRIEIGDDG